MYERLREEWHRLSSYFKGALAVGGCKTHAVFDMTRTLIALRDQRSTSKNWYHRSRQAAPCESHFGTPPVRTQTGDRTGAV